MVEMYCTELCPYCKLARALFAKKGIAYVEHRIDKAPELRGTMLKRCHRKTVPQIFINNMYVGGWEQLSQLEASGQLDRVLDAVISKNHKSAHES
jgi:glutaredoxin 3